MNCEDVTIALDDAHDSGATLDPAIARHVAGCPECRSYAAFLATLRERADGVAREREPGRDLWPGIAARLDAPKTVAFRARASRSVAPWWAAAAAAVVAAAVTFALTRPPSDAPRAASASPATMASDDDATASVVPASHGAGDEDYARAMASLLAALDQGKDRMAPGTRVVVERNLAVIDRALSDIQAALAKDPNNTDLMRLFSTTRKRKVETLRQVVRLLV